jgi:hypothetical protein
MLNNVIFIIVNVNATVLANRFKNTWEYAAQYGNSELQLRKEFVSVKDRNLSPTPTASLTPASIIDQYATLQI